MTAQVRIGGVPIDSLYPVADLTDSTRWVTDGYSGDFEASCTWAAPPDFNAPWFSAGALFDIYEAGELVWRGPMAEPQQGDTWSLTAFGSGAETGNYRSQATDLDADITAAAARGLSWTTYGGFGGGWVEGGATLAMLDEVCDRQAKSQGKFWWVSKGIGDLRAEPTGVSWLMVPDSAYLGTTDEEYVTSLTILYVTGIDSEGNPASYGTQTVSDTAAAAKFRPRERWLDATAAGIMTSANALATVEARFAQVGLRMGYTNTFEMTRTNSMSALNCVPNPMGARAGQRVRIHGLSDSRSGVSYLAATEVTLGKVTRNHTEQTVTCEPVGFVARGFEAALEALAAPAEPTEVL